MQTFFGALVVFTPLLVVATSLPTPQTVASIQPQAMVQRAPEGIVEAVEAKSEPTDYFVQYFGEKAPQARLIAKCESGNNPKAVHKNTNGTEDRGILQINSNTWSNYTDKPFSEAFDEKTNIEVASKIYQKRSFQPWYSSKKCHKLTK